MITEIDRDRLGSVFREALIDYLASPAGSDRAAFRVLIGGRMVEMYATIGPGDTPAPVLTVLLEGED